MYAYGNSDFGTGYLIFSLLWWVILPIIGFWRIFEKAGKPGWAALIPIYNYIVVCELIGKPVWWFLLFLIPCLNIIFGIWALNLVSKSFGQSEGFTVGFIIFFPVFALILGFGNYTYLGPAAAEAHAANRYGSADYQRPWDNNTPL